jgi:hypothetical protein
VVTTEAPSVHVEPAADGRWLVCVGPGEPQSVCANANDAEAAARRHAEALGVETILLYDRYLRVRTLRSRPKP